mgnify:CR=1 FL=1
MTKTDDRFVSKLELHIMHRMLKGENLYEVSNVYFMGFASKNKREMKLTPIGVQIAKEFTI